MWYSPMEERARDNARGALDRGHPQGLQHRATPRPRRAPQSRVRAEKGAVSIRIHSARLHHFLAKGMDLWSGSDDVTSQNFSDYSTYFMKKEICSPREFDSQRLESSVQGDGTKQQNNTDEEQGAALGHSTTQNNPQDKTYQNGDFKFVSAHRARGRV